MFFWKYLNNCFCIVCIICFVIDVFEFWLVKKSCIFFFFKNFCSKWFLNFFLWLFLIELFFILDLNINFMVFNIFFVFFWCNVIICKYLERVLIKISKYLILLFFFDRFCIFIRFMFYCIFCLLILMFGILVGCWICCCNV